MGQLTESGAAEFPRRNGVLPAVRAWSANHPATLRLDDPLQNIRIRAGCPRREQSDYIKQAIIPIGRIRSTGMTISIQTRSLTRGPVTPCPYFLKISRGI